MNKQSTRGFIPIIVIFIALVVIGGGVVGVKSGLLKLTAAPSNPPKNTPTPIPQNKVDFSQDIPKPSFTPQIGKKTASSDYLQKIEKIITSFKTD